MEGDFDITQDICNIIDAIGNPLVDRMIEAGVDPELGREVITAIADATMRGANIAMAAANIPIVDPTTGDRLA